MTAIHMHDEIAESLEYPTERKRFRGRFSKERDMRIYSVAFFWSPIYGQYHKDRGSFGRTDSEAY